MNELLLDHNLNIRNTIASADDIIDSYRSIKKNIPLEISQLRDNNFRYNYFNYRNGFLQGGVLYKDLCKILREYIVKNGLFMPDGSVKCNECLRAYCKTDIVSFFELVKQFTVVLL